MSLPSLLSGRAEVRGSLFADLRGRVLEATTGSREETERAATASAAVVNQFTTAGSTIGLAGLETLTVKGSRRVTVTAVRANAFLLVAVDPAKTTVELEKALQSWSPLPPPIPTSSPPSHRIVPAVPTVAPGAAATVPPVSSAPSHPARDDPWAVLRRALVRGQLTEASTRQRELDTVPSASASRPGGEPLDPLERERVMRLLLEGIGSVMAGDGVSGLRTLSELTASSQRNLSFRWLALQWSTRAALKSGNLRTAQAHLKEALTIARQLDMEAHAVSQWTAAEVLAHAGDWARALVWVKEARTRFERIGDRWGLGQTWFTEAQIRALAQQEPESTEAANRALAINPEWDEPTTFLARRALMRNDLTVAEEILRSVKTPASDRVRMLIEAIRQGTVTQANASEFLREQDAPPSLQAIHTLERIAKASPEFTQAREALAWMLLKLGRYLDANTLFRELLTRQLSPLDRASVMMGLGCIAHAQQRENGSEKRLRAVVNASQVSSPLESTAEASPLPILSSSVLNANGSSNSVFSGQLSGFALPDLLEFLRGARRTGLLVCSSAAGMGVLRFRDGWIIGAASPVTPDVGQLLLAAGKISAAALHAAKARSGSDQSDQVVGELLVHEGLVTVAAIQEALTRQIELTVREFVGWKNGEFAFNSDGENEPSRSEISVTIDPQAVLLNLFKEMDEASRSPSVDVEI